jgi:hypothetical protein
VVNAAGRLTPGHERAQAQLLADENVVVHANRVVGFAAHAGKGTGLSRRRQLRQAVEGPPRALRR